MNIPNSLSWVLNSIQSSHSEHIVLHNILYPVTPIWQVFLQLSIINIEYHNLRFNSSYLTFLVLMSAICIPPSYHTVLCKLYSLPFITKYICLEMCLVYLVSLPFLAMHIADFLSNIIRGACYRTIYGSLFNNSLFIILKCAWSIPVVHSALYSLSPLDWATGPGTYVEWSIGPPW